MAQQIPPLVRIASVADTYVTMTSGGLGKEKIRPYNAVEAILAQTQRGLYEPNAVRGLLRTISLFPLGSYIQLSDNSYAITIRNHPDFYDRPTVKVLCDSFGLPIQQAVIDLVEQHDLHIIGSICSTDVEKVMKQRTKDNQILDSTVIRDQQTIAT